MRNNVIRYNNSTDNIPSNIKYYFYGSAINSTIEIQKSDEIEKAKGELILHVYDQNSKINIGKNLKIRGTVKIEVRGDNNYVHIGDNCLFANDITILTTDYHRIYDKNGKLLNPQQPVVIEDNVWIARHVKILKGSHISKNSAVGICSVVNKKFDKENILIAGIPAKIVREGIYWKE
ncbi:acyltransferase [bacterium]|nr:acyltransferase [bacterium]